jgi:hypothetical protein
MIMATSFTQAIDRIGAGVLCLLLASFPLASVTFLTNTTGF